MREYWPTALVAVCAVFWAIKGEPGAAMSTLVLSYLLRPE